ncbi:4-alpha-glucanotransferase [Novosphingobium sp. PC22D]|uniref:4-alpha-glucanotransferase n=1 Tax=Novosphingobium sp. PC22D TaxID=1962403 RepID=UPI000BF05610|nr:4-alpha-glucanotransferase [Novosphingobium sp. PC22D]PEQ13227.1 4-alpha-glucanotransferase [Novosphingobium sp. PC22D]
MNPLHRLAEAIGLSRTWRNVEGREQTVSDASLARIAAALGYPADSDAAIAESLSQARAEAREPPAMIVTRVGEPTRLPESIGVARLRGENGEAREIPFADWTLPAIEEPGYYALAVNGHALTLAVAPPACPAVADLLPPERVGDKLWGTAIQIPALRTPAPSAFGDFGALASAVDTLAARGADAIAINPVHALFPGNGEGFSPYSPSSRLHLNGAMGDPALLGLAPLPADADEPPTLIDWEHALPRRLENLRAAYRALDDETRARIAAEAARHGEGLHRQAVFDALDCRFRPEGAHGWQDWPAEYHDPAGKAVAEFARDQADEVAFHAFTQWLARESLAAVQMRAGEAGMAVGLVADLAVGVHTGGADTWAMRGDMLHGLTIGAPPDPLGPLGQNWMLTTFSPLGLKRRGYAPWIATLRAALERTGALRIDHAFGLARLWVVPEGEDSSAGAYLTYPFKDLLGLAALEAHRARALIIAEDLGTAPHGFTAAIERDGLLGMRVLWFERAADEGFIGAADYSRDAVAMTGTHDTATVAGWWTGRDLDWAVELGRLPEDTTRAEAEACRDRDRALLWASLSRNAAPHPAANDPAPVCEAALRHIGATPSVLAIVPLEDLLCEVEQPNLPGTVSGHPNWRRRLAASLDALLAEPGTKTRIAALDAARKR